MEIDKGLPLIQDADLEGKVVLVRVDHNVVKKGLIVDPYRIDATFGTLYNIVERGGRIILMTHVGRTRDKKTGKIKISNETSVSPIVDYIETKLHARFLVPEFREEEQSRGYSGIDTSINLMIKDLKKRKIGGIYLPNTRWFQGEEGDESGKDRLARQLAGLADVFVNDAFGSWQPHASTVDVARHLPSFAGFLMQKEISNLNYVLSPNKPFLAVVAGAKFDTKIGPLKEIYKKVDHLILGGVIYNAYLCAKYGVRIAGVPEEDIESARDLLALDSGKGKILELKHMIESDTLDGKSEGHFREICTEHFKEGDTYGYILDVSPRSFSQKEVEDIMRSAKTIFVNAVMGFTPHFWEGSKALDEAIDKNAGAMKLYGGGDTLQEFKNLCPGLYLQVLDNSQYYFFTGGGTVLTAIQHNSPYDLPPIRALMERKGK
ncbi:MAG: phosphoglycerate kinase [Nitrospinae bacterium]|nr:phosphoglycerate kinase [Nitrospinota bacterium]